MVYKKNQWTGESLQKFCATKKKGRFRIWLSCFITFRISLPDPKDINEGELIVITFYCPKMHVVLQYLTLFMTT